VGAGRFVHRRRTGAREKEDTPTGFWPEFLTAVEGHFKSNYNVGFERVWAAGSADTMNLLLTGDADVTEPYWTVDAYHEGTPRPHAFIYSCSTLGYDSTFLVADTTLESEIKREEALASEVEELKLELDKLREETGTGVTVASFAVAAGALFAFL
jgi:hypothetical protein